MNFLTSSASCPSCRQNVLSLPGIFPRASTCGHSGKYTEAKRNRYRRFMEPFLNVQGGWVCSLNTGKCHMIFVSRQLTPFKCQNQRSVTCSLTLHRAGVFLISSAHNMSRQNKKKQSGQWKIHSRLEFVLILILACLERCYFL